MPRIQQNSDIVPPSAQDLDQSLPDFSAGVQNNVGDLFGVAHGHNVLSGPPSDADGSVGDIELVDDGTNQYLYAKFQNGWKRFVPA
jgi:hypothetical protein